MKQFGRRGKVPPPPVPPPVPADIDLAERLEGALVEPRLARRASGPPPAPADAAEPGQPVGGPGPLEGAGPEPGRQRRSPATAEQTVPPPDPNVDRLTDLFGPAVFDRLLAAESARSKRYRHPATLVLAELAGLEALTREWGFDVGIEAVTSLADVLQAMSRTSDYLARIVTNRFAVILTETDEIAAINYVERVREAWGAQQAIVVGAIRVGIGWAGTPGRATLLEARTAAEKMLRDDLSA